MTLGAATVIATDKTGTLTRNQLRVVTLEPLPGHGDAELLLACGLSSTAGVDADGIPVGDPVDMALLAAALERGPDPRAASGRRVARVLPFDPERRRSTAAHHEGPDWHIVAKGAPEVFLDSELPADHHGRHLVLQRAGVMASRGLRVLAVAERHAPLNSADRDLEQDLRIIGLIGLADPLRDTSAAAVDAAHRAGVRVVMVTGDHPATAAAIARRR